MTLDELEDELIGLKIRWLNEKPNLVTPYDHASQFVRQLRMFADAEVAAIKGGAFDEPMRIANEESKMRRMPECGDVRDGLRHGAFVVNGKPCPRCRQRLCRVAWELYYGTPYPR